MKTREDFDRFLAEVRKTTGIDDMESNEAGLVSVRVQDEFNVHLQFIEETGRVLCFIEVAELPKDAGREVYRDLLAGGLFGKETSGGYFTLEPETETVVYNYFFDLETAASDVEEFISALEKIMQLCDFWAERINDKLSGDNLGSVSSQEHHFHIHP